MKTCVLMIIALFTVCMTQDIVKVSLDISPQVKQFVGWDSCNLENYVNILRWTQFTYATDTAEEVKTLKRSTYDKIVNNLINKDDLFKNMDIRYKYYSVSSQDVKKYLDSDDLKSTFRQADKVSTAIKSIKDQLFDKKQNYAYADLLPAQTSSRLYPTNKAKREYLFEIFLEALIVSANPGFDGYLVLAYSSKWRIEMKTQPIRTLTEIELLKLFMQDIFQAKFGVVGTNMYLNPTPNIETLTLDL